MESFKYRIYDDVYKAMKRGNKKIEIRLYNEKSSQIKKGDIIKFCVLDSEDKYLLVRVTNLYKFKDLDSLWPLKDKILATSRNLTKEEFTIELNNIFGKDAAKNHEFIGIEFELL